MLQEHAQKKLIRLLFQLSAFSVLAGRAYQHLIWDAPYRAILWDEELMAGPIRLITGLHWEQFAGNPECDLYIQFGIKSIGFVLLFCSGAVWFSNILKPKYLAILMWLASAILLIIAMASFKDRSFQIGQLIEHSLQIGAPLFWLFYFNKNNLSREMEAFIKIAIVFTFVGHGLYAIGYHPVPGHFLSMCMQVFQVDEEGGRFILRLAGYFDFLVILILFIPRKWSFPFLFYCMIWGFSTALARLLAHIEESDFLFLLHRWFYEFFLRFPHFLIPLLIFLWIKGRESQPKSANLH